MVFCATCPCCAATGSHQTSETFGREVQGSPGEPRWAEIGFGKSTCKPYIIFN